jgi:outer membrane protein OmpA-like peptidoglycan-associated protein/Tol biopolymer transport system component
MIKSGLLVFFLAVLVIGTSFGQSAKKFLKNANTMFENQQYKEAIPAYLEVLKLEPANPEANYRIGVCYLKSIHKHKALIYLEKAEKANPAIAPDIKLRLAVANQFSHKFPEALKYYKLYKPLVDKKNTNQLADIDRKIYECENGIEYMKNPVKAKIENMGPVINSKDEDFAPVISADESILVFTSRRPGSTGGALDDIGKLYEDVYISYNKNGAWTKPENIGKTINTDGHDASIALSPDGSQVFIYKSDNGGDIFSSKFDGVSWTKPEGLGKNVNTKGAEKSVSMTADGKIIYFTSDREGGMGGLDIYMSKKDKKGKWGEAINLGKPINTEYEDDAPFIHPDGKTLYFSSEGHAGMGMFDIYKTSLLDNGTWSQPENMGYPINTADDDIYFVLSADNRHGYYASEREGGLGDADIYLISMPKPEVLAEVTSKDVTIASNTETGRKKMTMVAKVESFNPITILKGTVRDALTKEVLEADLEVVDNEKNEVISELKTNKATGAYLVVLPSGKNYGIRVVKQDYLFHSENFDIPQSTNYQEIVKDVDLKKVKIGTKIVLRNIFFDFDKASLRPESSLELERLYQLLVDIPTLKIEVSGHTDNKGSAEYNKELSGKRAQSVVDYLIQKGIKEDRLKSAGYGFERPMATNDTDQGRQLNRRTEFEIIGN